MLTALEPLYVLVPFSSRVLATRRSQCRTKDSPYCPSEHEPALPSAPDLASLRRQHALLPYTSTVYMVQLGRQFDIHGVLKRVFYELVSSCAFWEDLFEVREQIRLSEANVMRLMETRLAAERARNTVERE